MGLTLFGGNAVAPKMKRKRGLSVGEKLLETSKRRRQPLGNHCTRQRTDKNKRCEIHDIANDT